MRKSDIIYKDKEYEIYKKDAGDIGTYTPADCLNLVEIGLGELAKWRQGGFRSKKDYHEILDGIIEEIESMR